MVHDGSTHDGSHKLPVREPGGSALPPTSPRLLGRCGPSSAWDAERQRANAPVMSNEVKGRTSLEVLRRSLGERLKVWRIAGGLTQAQLATRIGYSRSAVAGAESRAQGTARDFWVRCDAVLGAGGVLVAHYRRIVAAREREVFERAREAEAEREEKIRQWRASMNLPDETVVFVDPPVYY